jgi:hypothetical protein
MATNDVQTPQKTVLVHMSGSWFDPITARDTIRSLQTHPDANILVYCDWTSIDHTNKPTSEQWRVINNAIKMCDVLYFSFEHMEKRIYSATFVQFFIASTIKDKRIVVYDPAKQTRTNRNLKGFPVHPSFNHLMALPLYSDQFPNIAWIANQDEAFAKVCEFGNQINAEKEIIRNSTRNRTMI